ncbi:MAG: hypothetical protein ACK5SH_04020 [Pseudomonadota bacterium]
MEFRIDFGNAIPAAAHERDELPRFAAVPGVLMPLGGDEVLWRLRVDGSHHVMTRQVFDALSRCAGFHSLDRHAAEISSALPGLAGQVAAVRQVLDHLVARSLLIRDTDWIARLSRPAPVAPAPLRAVFIHAPAGSAHAPSLLDALAVAEAGHRGGYRYVVIDDGAGDPALRAAMGRLRATGAAVVHLDGDRRRALCEALGRAVPGAAAASPALRAAGPAAARNLAALLSAGARAVLLDAACGLPLHAASDVTGGLELGGSPLLPVRFHARADEALAAGDPVAGDPVAALAADCGALLGTLLAQGGHFPLAARDLAGLEPAALPPWSASTRIAALQVGRRGPTRERGRKWLFELDAGSRERFVADRDRYLRTLDQPSVCSGPSRARLLARTMDAPVVLDGGSLLPPSLHVGEGADALFGLFLQTVRPEDAVLVHPWTLAVRDGAPPCSAGAAWAPETPGLGSLLTDLLAPRAAELRAAAPEARLRGLAARLADLAAAPPARQTDLVQEYLGFCRADLVARLQATFAAAPTAPLFWQADVRAIIEANGRALTSDLAPRLDGWPEGLDAAGCADRFAREVGAFAATLDAWPALWAHARERGPALLDA